MMTVQTFGRPFFATPERHELLLSALASWKGTPFQRGSAGAARRGAGCDCVSFVEAVLVNLGAIQPIVWPAYVVRGGGKAMRDLLLEHLGRIPEFVSVGIKDPPAIGDVLACSSGQALHHLAIFAGHNTIWHAVHQYGVCTGNLHDPVIKNHLIAIYRVMESPIL